MQLKFLLAALPGKNKLEFKKMQKHVHSSRIWAFRWFWCNLISFITMKKMKMKKTSVYSYKHADEHCSKLQKTFIINWIAYLKCRMKTNYSMHSIVIEIKTNDLIFFLAFVWFFTSFDLFTHHFVCVCMSLSADESNTG